MHKLVIVDDEKIIVEGLKALIDWEKTGFSIVGEAYNGKDGVRVALETRADVVLTDIRMPLLTGHELITQIKTVNPNCRFIILSGYSNFTYAQEAMQLGTFCYLLKPIQADQLIDSLAKIKQEIDLTNKQDRELEKLKNQLWESIPIVKERYLCDMVTDDTMQPEQILKKWRFLNLDYDLSQFEIFVLEIDGLEKKYGDDIEKMMLLKFAAMNIAEELVNSNKSGVLFSYSKDRIAILCCKQKGCMVQQEEIDQLAQSIQTTIFQYLNVTVSIGMGKLYTSLAGLCKTFQEAERALQYKLIYGKNSLIHIQEIENESTSINFPVELEKNLLSLVELGKTEAAKESLHNIFVYVTQSDGFNPQLLYNLCLNFVVLIYRCATMCGIPYDNLSKNKNFPHNLLEMKTVAEIENYLERIITDTSEKIKEMRMKKQQGTLGKIKEYVEQNFAQDLTLDFLAKKFFINACYLSQLFKKELNCNFVDFLTAIRIEEAKRLMLHTDLKVYEVGTRTGYNNPRYFSQVFERFTGETPSEYRRKANT